MARNADQPKLVPSLDQTQLENKVSTGVEMFTKYRLVYLGSLAVDRRYTPAITQWVVREISRVRKNRPTRIDLMVTTDRLIITNVDDGDVVETIELTSVVKLPRLRNLTKTLAFVSGGRLQSDQCYCYVFASETQDMVGTLSNVSHIRFLLFPV